MSAPSLLSFHFYLYGADRGPLPTSFEAAAQRLERLEKLYFEPDGSFVWSPAAAPKRTSESENLYGMLYDAVGVVQYCDIRGKCHRSSLSTLVQTIAGNSTWQHFQVLHLPESRWQNFQSFATFDRSK